ncbi:hypothetical protein ACFQ0B_65150 [Nonomuraea thailandensis]
MEASAGSRQRGLEVGSDSVTGGAPPPGVDQGGGAQADEGFELGPEVLPDVVGGFGRDELVVEAAFEHDEQDGALARRQVVEHQPSLWVQVATVMFWMISMTAGLSSPTS